MKEGKEKQDVRVVLLVVAGVVMEWCGGVARCELEVRMAGGGEAAL
jgi:hypothetical protein